MTQPVVAIVGRPNVGKSTLFNRILGSRIAITDDKPGSTRDRNCKSTQWAGRDFLLADTGGYMPFKPGEMEKMINRQVRFAVQTADLVIFLVDVLSGVTDLELMIRDSLLKMNAKVLVCVNKVDNDGLESELHTFFTLGFGPPFGVSAKLGRNIGDLLDLILENIPEETSAPEAEDILKIAILGKTNVGKSSLVNRIAGKEVVLTSGEAGTTRDSVDTIVKRYGKQFVLIDTAGLKRKGREEDGVGFYSHIRSLRSLSRCNVAVILLDAAQAISGQDIWISRMAMDSGRAIVIAGNKWDKVEKSERTATEYERKIRHTLRFISFAPLLFVSAKTNQRVFKILEYAERVREQSKMKIPTPEINNFLAETSIVKPPPVIRGKETKFYYGVQSGTGPPAFTVFTNTKYPIPEHYQRFLRNRIRERYGFEGNPILIRFKARK